MEDKEKLTKLIKFLKSLPNEYDMTDVQYDMWEDIMAEVKKINTKK